MSQPAFPWQNSWCFLTVAHECVHHSLSPLHVLPSHPLSLISPGYSWLPLEKTPGMADPESVFSFPKDLGFLCIYFRSCFFWMQMFSVGSFKQFSSPLWASAVFQVKEFSIPGEFGTWYWEKLNICKSCSALWELQIFPISEVILLSKGHLNFLRTNLCNFILFFL